MNNSGVRLSVFLIAFLSMSCPFSNCPGPEGESDIPEGLGGKDVVLQMCDLILLKKTCKKGRLEDGIFL